MEVAHGTSDFRKKIQTIYIIGIIITNNNSSIIMIKLYNGDAYGILDG